MPLTATGIKDAIYGLFSGTATADETMLKNLLLRQRVRCSVTDGGTAGTAQTETAFYENNTGVNMRLVSSRFLAPVTGAASGTNNCTVTLTKRDAAGGAAAIVSTYTSDVAGTGFTAFVPEALTNTVANVVIADGWVLTALVSKAGTGVAIAAATSQAYVEALLEPQT